MSREAKKEITELKKRALLAKQRLKMGYWQSMTEERNQALNEKEHSTAAVLMIKDIQLAKVKRDEIKILNSTQAQNDEKFYFKVCQILDNNENTTNPLGQLVEKEVYDCLDEFNKQRYILELSKKFREMRERYYRERLGKSC